MFPTRKWLPILAMWAAAAQAWAMEMISVKAGPAEEKGVYTMDALVTLDARPAAMRFVISRLCQYRDQTPYMAYCRVFRTEGNKAWSYAMVDPPVLDARDYSILSTTLQELNPDGSGSYKSKWQAEFIRGPKPRDGIIRLSVNEGSWTLRGLEGGKKTELRYQVRCGLGGVIPGWAASYVSKKTLPDYMRTLEKIALEEEARHAVLLPTKKNPWVGVEVLPLDKTLPSPSFKAKNVPLLPPLP